MNLDAVVKELSEFVAAGHTMGYDQSFRARLVGLHEHFPCIRDEPLACGLLNVLEVASPTGE